MRHRLKHHLFDREKSRQKASTPSTFTLGKNPHLTKHKLHSKSTYFYNDGSRINYVVPSMCTLALLIGGIICINPALDNSKAYAEEPDFNAANVDSANNDSGIMMASDPAINLTIAPDSGNTNSNVMVGEVAYFSNTITVGGSNITNYSLTLSTANGTNGDLVGETNAYATIGKVGSNTVPTSFPDNTWGYAISAVNTTPDKASLSYNPVPGTESNNSAFLDYQKNLSGAVNNTYKLVFAAKLGNTMPSDHYKANVYLSAVASATETVENWFRNAGITTMQQMNSTLCKNAPENATSQLRDERDGKLYWVTKLKDENCWMTQNLDYDGGGGQIALLSMWTTSNPANITNTTAAYFDPGDYVYNVGASGQNGNCSSKNFADCVGSSKQFSIVNADSNLHYHIGNYYSWDAATMGSMSGVAGVSPYDPTKNAPLSICPSGWQLPTSNNTDSKSFGGLMQAYSFTGNTLTNDNGSLYGNPMYFVYGGYLSGGQLHLAGNDGYYWSSTPFSNSTNAYYLYFNTSVNPSYNNSRYNGYSVRCVAK